MSARVLSLSLCATVLLAMACGPQSRRDDRRGGDDTRTADAGSDTFCEPGEELPCSCDDGSASVALCVEDGSRAGVCACSVECEPQALEACFCGSVPGERTCSEASKWGLCECEPVCAPNVSESCFCDNGLSGDRVCAGDGLSWGACECASVCEPGAEAECTCSSGAVGHQRCADDGSGFGECTCGDLECDPGEHDGGDGVCVLESVCSAGYHDGGDGDCRPLGECSPGYAFAEVLPGFGLCLEDSPSCESPPTVSAGPDQDFQSAGMHVGLSGAGSSAGTYQWRFESKPVESQATIAGATSVAASFVADVNGRYVVSLEVTDTEGCAASDTAVIQVGPEGAKAIRVELEWTSSAGDLDLHYLGPDGVLFDQGGEAPEHSPSDAHWYLRSPDWGLNGTTDADGDVSNDPALDADDINGTGPERLSHDVPFDGHFEVWVHNWCSTQPMMPTVTAFVDGVLVRTQTLEPLEQWVAVKALDIEVSNAGKSVTVSAPSTPATESYTGGTECH